MIPRRLLAIGLAAGALSSAGAAPAAAAPSLKATGSVPFVVRGLGFAPGERVLVSVHGVKGFAPRDLRASVRGKFRVTVPVLLRCGSLAVVRARGDHGRVAVVVLPAPPCVPPPRE